VARALFWLVGAVGAAGLALVALWSPPDDPVSSLCLTRRALGLPCPGCGLTRAVAQLVQGNFARAVALHPLAPLAALDAVVGWALWGLSLYGLAAAPPARAVRRVLVAQLALFVALWLGRLASGTAPF
jgi:hypothetical protein